MSLAVLPVLLAIHAAMALTWVGAWAICLAYMGAAWAVHGARVACAVYVRWARAAAAASVSGSRTARGAAAFGARTVAAHPIDAVLVACFSVTLAAVIAAVLGGDS